MKPIIEVNHVWKEYHKGIDRRYKSLRDTLVNISGTIFGDQKVKFWALEDIDFKVEAGESIGIIGRNGAGKSTLLKILSRITPPTKGEIILRGRVASLLEVGTGFHPELTGRENVFFNGSILGMKHAEIKQKFDEIVAFSGVESFIDTPLKHYSSGMQMRLAFSVAAHLDSEILLIDEVLAVGDAEFQKKCIGKMDEVTKGEGKTILFVSHDMNALINLTNRGILIKNAKKDYDATINLTLQRYIEFNLNNKTEDLTKVNRSGNGSAKIIKMDITSTSEKNKDFITAFNDVIFRFEFNIENHTKIDELRLDVGINNSAGRRVAWMTYSTVDTRQFVQNNQLKFVIEKLPLVPGDYNVNLYFEVNNQVADWLKNIGYFKIINAHFFNPNLRIPEGQGDILLQYHVQ